MNNARKVVLVHGLFVNRHIMRPLARHFRRQGYDTLTVNYPTRSRTLAETAAILLPQIEAFADGQPVDLIGHSLGGLLIRHLRLLLPPGRIRRAATLGTPHLHSAAAQYFRRFWHGKIIAQSWPQALDGNAPPWDAAIPLLSIAGTKARGVGTWFGLFREEASDGTVAVWETRIPNAAGVCDLPYGHTSMLFAREVMDILTQWLENGRCAHPGYQESARPALPH